jgi:quercetin dioxygenase-like cupin family protein
MKLITIDEQNWIHLPGYRKNVLLTDKDMHNEGTCVQIVTIAPGETIPNHYHKTSYEVYCVLQGTCQLFVNNEQLSLESGSILLMEPGDIHQLHNNGVQEFLLMVFKTNAGLSDTFWSP